MSSNKFVPYLRIVFYTMVILMGLSAGTLLAQEPDPRILLNQMSDEIAGLQSYVIEGDAYVDARLDAGLIIEHASQATLRVQKPDRIRISNRSSEDTKELYFDGDALTVFSHAKKYYAQADLPGSAGAALDYAVEELGIDVPMLDFVSGNVAERMAADANEILYFGPSLIRGKKYEHVVIRTPEMDIQIWIAAEGKPLPGKMALSAKWDGGAPRTVVFMEWDTSPEFPAGDLKFKPPEGAVRIQFEAHVDKEEK